jgi:hypothetical protein
MLIAVVLLVLAALARIAPTIDPSLVNFSPVMAEFIFAPAGPGYFRLARSRCLIFTSIIFTPANTASTGPSPA